MDKRSNEEKKLTPIERGARDSIVWHLKQTGFTNTAIANIMGMTPSSVTRSLEKKPDQVKLIDTVLWGIPL